MEFLAGTILDYLKEQIHNELAKPDKSKLIYIMPSFPSPVVTHIGDSMIVFKVLYELGKSWSESDKQIDRQAHKYITQKGWYDSENHLTSIRNLPRDKKMICLLLSW